MTRAPIFALLAAAFALAAACGQSGSPGGSGNDVVDDTRPNEPRAPQNPDENADASDDGPGYEGGEAGAPDLGACSTCTCDPSAYYCFGGATPRGARVFAKADASSDDAACAVPDAAAFDGGDPGLSPVDGCNRLPAGCFDCSCIIAALQPKYACYLVCADDGVQMLVYCPHF